MLFNNQEIHVFIGYDPREQDAYDVCCHTIKEETNYYKVHLHKIDHLDLRKKDLFWRKWSIDEKGQYWDELDAKPFSTEFSFTRFLVPEMCKQEKIKSQFVLYIDCDFMFRRGLDKLFDHIESIDKKSRDAKALFCVPFDDKNFIKVNTSKLKMDGKLQTMYPRKFWSSFTLWNLHHPKTKMMDVERVNLSKGKDLHSFEWIEDNEIEAVSPAWNYISGISDKYTIPFAVHFSEGGPWHQGKQDVPYADEWEESFKEMRKMKWYF